MMIKVGCVCRLGQDFPASSYVCFCRMAQTDVPETDVPETEVLETDDPETEDPDTDVAETDDPRRR